jgi:hypothetical protein
MRGDGKEPDVCLCTLQSKHFRFKDQWVGTFLVGTFLVGTFLVGSVIKAPSGRLHIKAPGRLCMPMYVLFFFSLFLRRQFIVSGRGTAAAKVKPRRPKTLNMTCTIPMKNNLECYAVTAHVHIKI